MDSVMNVSPEALPATGNPNRGRGENPVNKQTMAGTAAHVCAAIPTNPRPRTPGYDKGLLGRFERVKFRDSRKRPPAPDCRAAQDNYKKPGGDFLKMQGMNRGFTDFICEYKPEPDTNQTRFHKGFQKKTQAQIQQDKPRLEEEFKREQRKQQRMGDRISAALALKETNTFNILTGEGKGREVEFPTKGKRINCPTGSMRDMYSEHDRDARNRMLAGRNRFYNVDTQTKIPPWDAQVDRKKTLDTAGFSSTKPHSLDLGYGSEACARGKFYSVGVKDNFRHSQLKAMQPKFDAPYNKNQSQFELR